MRARHSIPLYRQWLAAALGLLLIAPALAVPRAGPVRLLSASLDEYAAFMLSGGPGKDGIPAIDQPRFSAASGCAPDTAAAPIVRPRRSGPTGGR